MSIDALMGSSAPEVMIGGLDGVLIYSSNGTSWTSLDSQTAKHLKGISIPVAGTAWIMGTSVSFNNPDTITLIYQ